jgi:hypothetical protein
MTTKAVFKLVFSKASRFLPQLRLYGFSVAFWTLLFPAFSRLFGPLKFFFAAKKHKAILSYLYKRYSSVIKIYAGNIDSGDSEIQDDSTIWVCWWDGLNSMPDIVKACYKYLLHNAGSHPVQFIDKNNYMYFTTIPDYIIEKVNNKIITITHFSDILRAELLYNFGGIWMDATILTLNIINLNSLAFYTLKAPARKSVSISLARFAGLSDGTIQAGNAASAISRWSGFLLAGTKGSPVFDYMRKILYAYWKDHDDQIDYLLHDYTITLGYDKIPLMKALIDSVPCSNQEKCLLEKDLNSEYIEEKIIEYSTITFHKLTWKKKFNKYTSNNKLTIYGHFLEAADL